MNILFLYPNMNMGGAQKVILDLVNNLSKDNNYNIYLGTTSGKFIKRVNKNVNIINIPLNNKKMILKSIIILRNILHEKSIDVIHSHHRYTTALVYFMNLIKSKKVKLLHTEHSVYSNKNLFNFRGNNIVAVSQMVKSNLIKNNVESSKIEIIYNGVDNGSRSIRRLIDSNSHINIGVIARLSREKGHIYLFDAISKIIKLGYDVSLSLIGDGVLKDELKAYCLEKKISARVNFLGDKSDIYDEIQKYDFFILPSIQEGLPVSILEIMANGKIVICTDVGGNKEIITNQVNGFIVKSKSSLELMNAMINIIDNFNDFEFIENNAKNTIEEHFNIKSMVYQYECLYKKLK